MTALLSTRLRVAANGMKGIHADVAREAADEIERLRDCLASIKTAVAANDTSALAKAVIATCNSGLKFEE